jgi:hypothetical protein
MRYAEGEVRRIAHVAFAQCVDAQVRCAPSPRPTCCRYRAFSSAPYPRFVWPGRDGER